MSGGSQKVTQTNKTVLSPEQKELLNLGILSAKPVAENAPDLPQIQGFDPAQIAAQNSILGSAGEGGALSGFTNKLSSASNFLLNDAINVESNPALSGYIDAAIRPLEEQFTRVIAPGVRHEGIGTGAFSSYGGSRQVLAEDLANQGYLRQVGDTTSSILNNAYTQGLDALTKGVALAPQTQQSLLFPALAQEAIGSERRSLAQTTAQRDFENELLPFNLGLQLIGAAGAAPGGGTTGTVTGASPGSSFLSSLAGSVPAALAFRFAGI